MYDRQDLKWLIGNTDSGRMYKCLADASTGIDEGVYVWIVLGNQSN
jgi:hypothetical protein